MKTAPVGPRSLADLQKGRSLDGDDASDPTTRPVWLDLTRYERIYPFFKRHAFTLTMAWHCSLTIGFSLQALLEALVFTKDSDTPKKALSRYMITFQRLLEWHTGDIWDPSAESYRSVQAVRSAHSAVRKDMDAHIQPEEKWITMYDMACVQAGFMGFAITVPQKFGMRVPQQQLLDYAYFWRCVARQLGVSDKFNLCSLDFKTVQPIVWQIIDEVVVPSSLNPPKEYRPIAEAYIAGLNINLPFNLFSVDSTLALVYWGLDKPQPRSLTCTDWARFWFMRWVFLMIGYCPFFERIMSAVLLLGFKLFPPSKPPVCPTGRSSGRLPEGHRCTEVELSLGFRLYFKVFALMTVLLTVLSFLVASGAALVMASFTALHLMHWANMGMGAAHIVL